jgi:peptidoglycan/LPS O-acetylase OafA/YrhL
MSPNSLEAVSLNKYYKTLDCLRGIAALMVLAFHVFYFTHWPQTDTLNPFYWLARKGWMGVDLFFVLCGCVITYSLASLMTQDPQSCMQKFLLRRAARILPLYYITVIVCVIFEIIWQKFSLGHDGAVLLRYLFLLQSFPSSSYGSINGPNWSIGIEIQFYLLMMLIIPIVLKASYLRILILGLLFAWISKALIYTYLGQANLNVSAGMQYFCQLPPMFDAFTVGIILGKFLFQDAKVWLPRLWVYRWQVWTFSTLFLSTILVAWWSVDNAMQYPVFHIFMRSLLGISFGLIILSLALLEYNIPKAADGLMRIFIYLGTISYGIYLWHYLVIKALVKYTHWEPHTILYASILFTLIIASLSWHVLEKPFIRMAKAKH